MSVGVRYAHKWLRPDDRGRRPAGRRASARCSTSPTPATASRVPDRRDLPELPGACPRRSATTMASIPAPQAAVEPLVAEHQLPVEPPVRQLRRSRQLGRGRPHQPERRPLLRRSLHVVRRDRPAGLRPPPDRPSAHVQGTGDLRAAVRPRHGGRLLHRDRHAAAVDGDLQERPGLLPRPRRPGPDADLQLHQPVAVSRLPHRRRALAGAVAERAQPVRSGHGRHPQCRALARPARRCRRRRVLPRVRYGGARHGRKTAADPRYGQASAYQRPRQVRVEARFRF